MPGHRWLRETCTPARHPKGEQHEEDICRSRRPRHCAWNRNPDLASTRHVLQLREPEPGGQPGQRQLTDRRGFTSKGSVEDWITRERLETRQPVPEAM